MRFDDSPDLFGCGVGTSTCGDLTCDICKVTHNAGNDALAEVEGDHIYRDAVSVRETRFAGMTVCEYCFERIESEVLRRMPYILKWYTRILEARTAKLAKDKAQIDAVTHAQNAETERPEVRS